MTTQTTERAFEDTVESLLLDSGWRPGDRARWDVELALFPSQAIDFIRQTQPKQWDRVAALYGGAIERRITEELVKELDLKGTLEVLRHGFRFSGRTFKLAYFKPAHGLNPQLVAQFDSNRLTVTRQVRCHPGRNDTVDVLFALNGLPVATCELKNRMTDQFWKDAVRQYKQNRDPNAPLFRWGRRALVHFAVDSDEVHMVTKLDGERTRFLPFNRGSDPGAIRCGAGNPQHPSGYPTGYLWQEVLERERFLDVLGSYVFTEKREEKVEGSGGTRIERRETVIFPRYHQLDSVSKLVTAARKEGPGHNYLIQHSAGSGKTNSISWLSHRLATLHTEADEKVFDCVVVITDRRVLDRQLQDAIYQIEHAQGVVKAIDQDSQQLAEALVDGTMIVITTIQKFPFVMRGLLSIAGADSPDAPSETERSLAAEWRSRIAGRKYAVIVDEAHSSQTGESAREMKQVLGSRSLEAAEDAENAEDWEDHLNAVVESRGPQPNLSFFAFTATPKGKTIELFGRKGASGKPESFHIYSMRQAIEEEFILDVLRHYTDYDTWYRLRKRADDDPNFPKRRTAAALAKFMTLHPHNIAQKIEVIVEHFRSAIRPRIGGRAKAMLVASSRLLAVRYKLAFEKYVAEKGYDDVHALVAFSGTVPDPDTGEEYTEPGMNLDRVTGRPIGEATLAGRFDSSDYNVLLVADKYQTGFDQPLLQAMYVDKRLDGVQAVQTLSRLNRMFPGKDAPFVLDFVNKPEDVRAAFAPYYDRTQLLGESDPYRLSELKHELDTKQVYHQTEVEEFVKVFYRPASQHGGESDHSQLVAQLQPAVDRFRQLDEEGQTAFRDRLSAFVSLYAFLSQIIPYGDNEFERLASFGRALLPYLRPDREGPIDLGDNIELSFYRLQRVSTGDLKLSESEDDSETYVVSPTEVGTGNPEEEKAPLSEIIDTLNARFGTNLTDKDRLFFEQVKERAVRDEEVRRTAKVNRFDNFALHVKDRIDRLMEERQGANDRLVNQYMTNREYKELVFGLLAKAVYDEVKGEAA